MVLRWSLGVPQCNIVTRMPLEIVAYYVNKPLITSELGLHLNCPWRHLLGNRLLFVPHHICSVTNKMMFLVPLS